VTAPRPEHQKLSRVLGPGLLFAATSVGVSHIVQSTRAGALFGLGLLVTVVLVNVLKYPAFYFGARYALITGTSLLQGYRNIGRWAVVAYGLLNLMVVSVVIAALSLATAGVMITLSGITAPISLVALGLILSCLVLLGLGGYHILERLVKILVLTFTLLTIIATVYALIRMPPGAWGSLALFPAALDRGSLFFIVAFIGWMPTGLEASVWQSLWTLEKTREAPPERVFSRYRLDFNIGYIGTSFLALCFIILGAALMYGTGQTFAGAAPAFIAQVIRLYSAAIGPWSIPLAGLGIFAVLFSTIITVIDGFPRALMVCAARLTSDELPWATAHLEKGRLYFLFMALGGLGGYLLIVLWSASFKMFIDFATTTSFSFAPLIAFLNHRAMTGREIPAAMRPQGLLRLTSLSAIALLAAFAGFYGYLRVFS